MPLYIAIYICVCLCKFIYIGRALNIQAPDSESCRGFTCSDDQMAHASLKMAQTWGGPFEFYDFVGQLNFKMR
jgi:hypothetical protein